MKADFLDAHDRHWKDAELLFNAKRWANADHLYGLAVECGLKQLMVALGMSVDSTTGSPIDQKHLFHADRAWTCFESYCSGHHNGAGYKLPQKDPFLIGKYLNVMLIKINSLRKMSSHIGRVRKLCIN